MAQNKSPDERKPIFRLPEGPINLAVGFVDFEEFKRWCNEQRSYIRSIQFPPPLDHTAELLAPYERFLETVEADEGEEASNIDTIQTELENAAKSGLLVREHPVGEYLEKMGSPWTRAGYAARILGVKVSELHGVAYDDRKSEKTANQDLERVIKGYSLAGAMPGVQLLLDRENLRSYSELVEAAELEIADLSKQLSEAKAKVDSSMVTLQKVIEDHKKAEDSYSATLDGLKKRANNLKVEQDTIVEVFRKKIETDEARVFWSRKRDEHSENFERARENFWRISLVMSIAILVLLVLSICVVVGVPLPPISPILSVFEVLPVGWSVASAFAVFLPFFLFVWILRNLNATANMHQSYAEDARLRVVILTSYLAMASRDSHEVAREERTLLLNALFRPLDAKRGDDSIPPGLLEYFTR